MHDTEDDKIKQQMDEVKQLDEDLFEEDFYDEIVHDTEDAILNAKERLTKTRKLVIVGVSILLFFSIIGPLAKTFNIASIHFLIKSYQLSERSDIKEYKKAVVTIKSEDRKGTGFNISSDGLIVTNYHIVEKEDTATVSFDDGPTTIAKVIIKIPEKDIAVLQLDNYSNLPYLSIETNYDSQNKNVLFIGNPLMFHQIANEGKVIGVTTTELSTSVIVIEAPVYKGNSGSPVLNKEGKVIGIIYANGTVDLNGVSTKAGFAIPIDALPVEIFELIK